MVTKTAWALVWLLLTYSLQGGEGTYQRLEELTGSQKFSALQNDKRFLTLYESAAKQYFGEQNFSCEKFGTITGDINQLRHAILNLDQILNVVPTYPTLTISSFVIRPLKPMHAIWFDTHAMGCGQTICEMADPNAPERWAALLEGSQYFAVEQEGKFTGTVFLLTPLQKGGEVVGGFWTSGEASTSKDLAQEWLKEIRPHLPKNWNGVTNRLSEARPLDGRADKIASTLPRRCFGIKEARGENLLMGNTGAPTSFVAVKFALDDPKVMNELLNGYKGSTEPGKLAEVPAEQAGQLARNLGSVLFSNAKPAERARAADALGYLGKPKVDLPGLKVAPSAVGGLKYAAPNIAPVLTRALNDPSPIVRGTAATNLGEMGANSPAIFKAQQDLFRPENLNALFTGDSSLPKPGDILGRAIGEQVRRGREPTARQLGSLFDEAASLPPGEPRQEATRGLAEAFMKMGSTKEVAKFLNEKGQENPAVLQLMADETKKIKCPTPEGFKGSVAGKPEGEEKE